MARASAAGIKRATAEMRMQIVETLLPRVGRAIGNVIAAEARQQCISAEVRPSIKVRVAEPAGRVVQVFVETQGKGAYLAPWLEHGTDPHFITARGAKIEGGVALRGAINRANEKAKGGHALMIGGNFVGQVVLHPGARPYPFLRPAFDTKRTEAFAAGQRLIDRSTNLVVPPDADD